MESATILHGLSQSHQMQDLSCPCQSFLSSSQQHLLLCCFTFISSNLALGNIAKHWKKQALEIHNMKSMWEEPEGTAADVLTRAHQGQVTRGGHLEARSQGRIKTTHEGIGISRCLNSCLPRMLMLRTLLFGIRWHKPRQDNCWIASWEKELQFTLIQTEIFNKEVWIDWW